MRTLALAVSGHIQIYTATGRAKRPQDYLAGSGVSGVDWSGPIHGQSLDRSSSHRPTPVVDPCWPRPAPKARTPRQQAGDQGVWEYDSSKTSPIARSQTRRRRSSGITRRWWRRSSITIERHT
jgi:hypothetical protein